MIWLIFLLISLVQSINICVKDNTDLCLGFSGLSTTSQLAGLPLQLKSRYKSLVYDSELRIQFLENENGSLVYKFGNETLFVDKAKAGSHLAILSKRSEGVVVNGESVTLFNNTRCLTVMQCLKGGKEFCDITSEKPANEAVKGAYLNFLPCDNTLTTQRFLVDPPCKPFCTDDLLLNDVCDEECNYEECFYDFMSCNTTFSPTTNSPSKKPTKQKKTQPPVHNKTSVPTFAPSIAQTSVQIPTQAPTHDPVHHPTISPSVVDKNTVAPSNHPLSPTASLTHGPTIPPTLNPTSVPSMESQLPTSSPSYIPPPTFSPSLPSMQPTVAVTQNPTMSISPTLDNRPVDVTLSPTIAQSELDMIISVSVLVPLFIIFVLLCCLWPKNRKRLRKLVGHEVPINPPRLNLPNPNEAQI